VDLTEPCLGVVPRFQALNEESGRPDCYCGPQVFGGLPELIWVKGDFEGFRSAENRQGAHAQVQGSFDEDLSRMSHNRRVDLVPVRAFMAPRRLHHRRGAREIRAHPRRTCLLLDGSTRRDAVAFYLQASKVQ
jgi:hypothetical protein